jgi:hypothetical protein
MKLLQPSMRFIRECLKTKSYYLTKHAVIARLNRNITTIQLKQALFNGKIIEKYPDDTPYPSCLVLGWLESGDPLHIVCSRGDTEPELRIVTVYQPDDEKWNSDYKVRKVRK